MASVEAHPIERLKHADQRCVLAASELKTVMTAGRHLLFKIRKRLQCDQSNAHKWLSNLMLKCADCRNILPHNLFYKVQQKGDSHWQSPS